MASIGRIENNNKRLQMFWKYKSKRAELKKEQGKFRAGGSIGERLKVASTLSALPRNSSKVRVRRFCLHDHWTYPLYRARGFERWFGMSRHAVRRLAFDLLSPGVKNASW